MASTTTNADQLLQTLADEIAKLEQRLKASEEKLARLHGDHNDPSSNDPMATTTMITIKKVIANLDAIIASWASSKPTPMAPPSLQSKPDWIWTRP
jgi:predicted TIM-barrel enzyme